VPDDASDAAALPVMEVIEDELPLAEPHSFSAAAAAPEFVDNDEARRRRGRRGLAAPMTALTWTAPMTALTWTAPMTALTCPATTTL
jgi:hypothetical protein